MPETNLDIGEMLVWVFQTLRDGGYALKNDGSVMPTGEKRLILPQNAAAYLGALDRALREAQSNYGDAGSLAKALEAAENAHRLLGRSQDAAVQLAMTGLHSAILEPLRGERIRPPAGGGESLPRSASAEEYLAELKSGKRSLHFGGPFGTFHVDPQSDMTLAEHQMLEGHLQSGKPLHVHVLEEIPYVGVIPSRPFRIEAADHHAPMREVVEKFAEMRTGRPGFAERLRQVEPGVKMQIGVHAAFGALMLLGAASAVPKLVKKDAEGHPHVSWSALTFGALNGIFGGIMAHGAVRAARQHGI